MGGHSSNYGGSVISIWGNFKKLMVNKSIKKQKKLILSKFFAFLSYLKLKKLNRKMYNRYFSTHFAIFRVSQQIMGGYLKINY